MDIRRIYCQFKFRREPIIIGGCGRSGTTLLLSILSAHPHIYAIEKETAIFCPTAYDTVVNMDAPINWEKIFDLIKLENIFFSRYNRFCEKTPKNILFFNKLKKVFNNRVKLIQMVRDGRDVITSIYYGKPNEFWVKKERWIQDVTAGLDFIDDKTVLTIRYEDLIRNTEQVLNQVFSYIGEELTPEVKNYHSYAKLRTVETTPGVWSPEVQPIHDSSIGRWKDSKYDAVVNDLMSDERAVKLLKQYQYL